MAMVFITTMQGNEKHNEGLCLICAKELGVPQVSEYIKNLGLSDEDLENLPLGMEIEQDEDDESADDGFSMGGADTMPEFFKDMMKQGAQNDGDETGDDLFKQLMISGESDSDDEYKSGFMGFDSKTRDKKKNKKDEKKRKFLETYCTNLTRNGRSRHRRKIRR